jgi:hypothetical protein
MKFNIFINEKNTEFEKNSYQVTIAEINIIDKKIDVITDAKNKRQLDYAESVLSKILNLKKEYDDIIHRLLRN